MLKWFKKYPPGYATIFFVKLLGNFSFYGLRSVLVLFLTSKCFFSDTQAFDLYGSFMAIAYLVSIAGGWLCDRFLGIRNAIIIGGIFGCLGCFFIDSTSTMTHFFGLAFVAFGIGLFQPSTSSAVGSLFSDASEQRESPYTMLYVGMNFGNFLSLFLCGWIVYLYGWTYMFKIMGIVILLGSGIFFKNFKTHPNYGSPFQFTKRSILKLLLLFLTGFLTIIGILFYESKVDWLIPSLLFIAIIGCLGVIYLGSSRSERKNVLLISLLVTLYALFSAFFEQSGSSIVLFIERGVNRTLINRFTLPTPLIQSLNPILVMIIGPFISKFWNQTKHSRTLRTLLIKFGVGFFFLCLTFFTLAISIQTAYPAYVHPLWIVAVFLFQVLSEFCVIPIGWSAISTLAPKKYKVTVMGMWMVTISCGHYLAGTIAKLSSTQKLIVQSESLEAYQAFFVRSAFFTLFFSLCIGTSVFVMKQIFNKRNTPIKI